MKRFDFHKQLERGKIGEAVIISLLKEEYIEYKIENVSERKEYQELDIDLILTHETTGESFTVEIKCDETNYKNWNIFAEYCSCERTGSPGWIKKSKADFICYAFAKRGVYFMIPREVLLDMIQIYDFKVGTAFDRYKKSLGYLIPVNLIEAFENKMNKEKFEEAYAYA